MKDIYDVALTTLAEDGWSLVEDPEKGLIQGLFEGQTGRFPTNITALDIEGYLGVHVVLPQRLPREKRDEALIYFCRVNQRLRVGAFELDLDSGICRFRSGLELGELDHLPAPLLRTLLYGALAAADRYYFGLMALLNQGVDPITAMERADAPRR